MQQKSARVDSSVHGVATCLRTLGAMNPGNFPRIQSGSRICFWEFLNALNPWETSGGSWKASTISRSRIGSMNRWSSHRFRPTTDCFFISGLSESVGAGSWRASSKSISRIKTMNCRIPNFVAYATKFCTSGFAGSWKVAPCLSTRLEAMNSANFPRIQSGSRSSFWEFLNALNPWESSGGSWKGEGTPAQPAHPSSDLRPA